jgi:hypothetical protein
MSHVSQQPSPTLDDFLGDPIVRILMQSDGVSEQLVRDIIAKASATWHPHQTLRLVSFCPRFSVREKVEAKHCPLH